MDGDAGRTSRGPACSAAAPGAARQRHAGNDASAAVAPAGSVRPGLEGNCVTDNDGGFRFGVRSLSRSKLLVDLNSNLVILRKRVETARLAGAATRLLEQQEAQVLEKIRRLRLSI